MEPLESKHVTLLKKKLNVNPSVHSDCNLLYKTCAHGVYNITNHFNDCILLYSRVILNVKAICELSEHHQR
jgi:hypothetical protein